jgi:hypothetical protein
MVSLPWLRVFRGLACTAYPTLATGFTPYRAGLFRTNQHLTCFDTCVTPRKKPCGLFVRQTLRLGVLYQHLGHYQPACGRRSPVIHLVLFSCPGLLAKSPCLRTWLVVRHRVLLHRFQYACLASSSEALTSYEPSLMNRSHLAGSTDPGCLTTQEFDFLHTRSGQSLLLQNGWN